MSNPDDFAATGAFVVSMEKAGMGESFEAAQARVVIEVLSALHERIRLAASDSLNVPVLNEIPPADQAAVDRLYAVQARFILGGLQDHLNGLSLQRFPVKPEVLQLAKKAGLVSAR